MRGREAISPHRGRSGGKWSDSDICIPPLQAPEQMSESKDHLQFIDPSGALNLTFDERLAANKYQMSNSLH
jgi:hypothetical protein